MRGQQKERGVMGIENSEEGENNRKRWELKMGDGRKDEGMKDLNEGTQRGRREGSDGNRQ